MASMLLDDDVAAPVSATARAVAPHDAVGDIPTLPWLYPWFLAMGGILMTLALMR